MNCLVLVFVLLNLDTVSFAQPNFAQFDSLFAEYVPVYILHSGKSSIRLQETPPHLDGKTLPDVLTYPQEYLQNSSVPATDYGILTNMDKRRVEHKCPVCNKSFQFFSYMQDHWRVHMDLCTFRCRLCTKSYKFLRGLRQHLRTAHTGQVEIHPGKLVEEDQESTNKRHLCAECGKFFKRCDNLQVHRKTIHDKQVQHACALCGHVFNRRTNYLNHIRKVHSKELQNNCEQYRQLFLASLHVESNLSTTHQSDHE